MTKNWGAWMFGGFLATMLVTAYAEWQDPLPYKRISPNYGHGQMLFGNDKQPAKIKHAKIGHIERWDVADGRNYSLQVREISVRDPDPNWIVPTDEEFDEWLAYSKTGGDLYLQEWLIEHQ